MVFFLKLNHCVLCFSLMSSGNEYFPGFVRFGKLFLETYLVPCASLDSENINMNKEDNVFELAS